MQTIRREHVKAVFAESSVNPKVEAAIAREAGARVGRALWADSLGPEGSPRRDLRRLDRANTAAIAEGFRGERRGATLMACS